VSLGTYASSFFRDARNCERSALLPIVRNPLEASAEE
jgi:hypothetical protein